MTNSWTDNTETLFVCQVGWPRVSFSLALNHFSSVFSQDLFS